MKRGEIVRLKSGGPVMVVVSVIRAFLGDGHQMTKCVWMDEENKVQHRDYSADLLESAPTVNAYRRQVLGHQRG